MLRDLLENATFLYNTVLVYFLAALPGFLTVHHQIILPSRAARLVYAVSFMREEGQVGRLKKPRTKLGEEAKAFY